jgi:hypothetical protein
MLDIAEGAGRSICHDKQKFYVITCVSVFEVAVLTEPLRDEGIIYIDTFESELEGFPKFFLP